MGVDINPARRYQQAASVDFAPTGASLAADCCDCAVFNRNVAIDRWRSRTIDDFAIANDEVIHIVRSPSAEAYVICQQKLGHFLYSISAKFTTPYRFGAQQRSHYFPRFCNVGGE